MAFNSRNSKRKLNQFIAIAEDALFRYDLPFWNFI